MSAPVALHLMRHGATARGGELIGRTDCPATQQGIAECIRAAKGLAVAAVVTSDLLRARACAGAIGVALDKPVTVDARWREMDFGAWDGMRVDAIDPAALRRFHDDPDEHAPPGGERWGALVERVARALDAIEEPTLIVTHGGAMRAALAAACGFDLRHCWAFDLPYSACLSLRRWRGDPPFFQITGLSA